jgi:hypothetical protein
MPTTRLPRRSSSQTLARTRLAQLERERRRILDRYPDLVRMTRRRAVEPRTVEADVLAFWPMPRSTRVH